MDKKWEREQKKIRNNFYARCCSLKIKADVKAGVISQLMTFDDNLKKFGFLTRKNILNVYFEGATNCSTAKIKYIYEDKRGDHECYESFVSTQSMIDFIKGFNQAVYTVNW